MIYVLDAMCGAGKSTSMINSIRGNMDKKWIYITPFLSEIEERLPRVIPEANFKSPIITKDSVSKLESIKVLLSNGDNISTTHALFKLLDRDAVKMILNKQYCIVIDEAVGLWLTLALIPYPSDILPATLSFMIAFFMFRLFDIAKPWPINYVDKNIKGAHGIMFDDVIAGLLAALSTTLLIKGYFYVF